MGARANERVKLAARTLSAISDAFVELISEYGARTSNRAQFRKRSKRLSHRTNVCVTRWHRECRAKCRAIVLVINTRAIVINLVSGVSVVKERRRGGSREEEEVWETSGDSGATVGWVIYSHLILIYLYCLYYLVIFAYICTSLEFNCCSICAQ